VAVVTEDAPTPAACAADIDAARDRLIGFVDGCSEEQWRAAPLAPDGGRVRRLAQIAARHADDHRADLEAALARSGG
jgi:hypothetical protein